MKPHKDLIQIPNYVGGKFKRSAQNDCKIVNDYEGAPVLCVHQASKWTVEAAVETTSAAQFELSKISHQKIMRVLALATEVFLASDESRALVQRLSGSSRTFVNAAITDANTWCQNLDLFFAKTFGNFDLAAMEQPAKFGHLHGVEEHATGSAPVFAILPSNSEQEVIFIVAQSLLAKNAIVVRPSSQSAGSYVLFELIKAINWAVDQLGDPNLRVIKEAISALNFAAADEKIEQLFIDGWNYIIFGHVETTQEFEAKIRRAITPGKVIKYGSGFSSSILLADANLLGELDEIVDSIVMNRGNECICTDIIYVDSSLYEPLLDGLTERLKSVRSGDEQTGTVAPENSQFMIDEFQENGWLRFANISPGEPPIFHNAVVPLDGFENTIEYPGPVVAVRPFADLQELGRLIERDLQFNGLSMSLVSSVFTKSSEHFGQTIPQLKARAIRWNKPTHAMDLMNPHNGICLLRELSSVSTIEI